jgi:cysteine desulfurase
MKPMIYADHAATTKLDADAFEAMKPYLLEAYGNPSQAYAFAREPKRALLRARETIARCIHAQPEEIFFTSGGTEGDNWAIRGIASPDPRRTDIITSQMEHHAVLRACEAAEELGCAVTHLPVTREGIVTPTALEAAISPSTCLVSVMLANNEIGTIQPIQDLCGIAHRNGSLFHTDAVQAVGHIQVDVEELGVDLLSASAHKFNGPKGIGFLYVKNGTPLHPLLRGGAQELGMRAGTENVAAIVGMAVALEKNCNAIPEAARYLSSLEARLLEGITQAGLDFRRNGGEPHLPGNVSLSFKHADGEALLHRLDLMGICVSTGAACTSGSTQVSHVLRAIGADPDYAPGTIRISLGRENTAEEVDRIVGALAKILRKP